MSDHRCVHAFVLALFGPSIVLLGQDELRRAIDDLGYPERQVHAQAVLEASGAPCVPLLRELLARVASADEPRPLQVTGALYVLGRLRQAAVAALPEAHHTYDMAADLAARNQAIWTLTTLATASDDATCGQVCEWLQRNYTQDLDAARYQFAFYRLQLGAHPTDQALRSSLNRAFLEAVAAASAAADANTLEDATLDELGQALDAAVLRTSPPWMRSGMYDGAAGELGAALWQHGRRGPRVARGLLQHWDPGRRLIGISAIASDETLTPAERIDVVACLWDPERRVREQALAAIQGCGARGLVALRALRALQTYSGASRLADVYRRAADRLVAAVRDGTTAEAAALVADIDRVLCGQTWDRQAPAADDAGCRLLAEVVIGCRGATDGVLENLADFAVARHTIACPSHAALLAAFLDNLHVADIDAWHHAACAIAKIGPSITGCTADLAASLLQSFMSGSLRADLRNVFPVEATILAGSAATTEELRKALASKRWPVVLRALVEMLQRSAFDARDARLLHSLAAAEQDEVQTFTGAEFSSLAGLQYRLHQRADNAAVHVAAALALASIGETPWSNPALADELATAHSIDAAEVAAFVGLAIAEHRLGELALDVERQAWKRARWPPFP